MKLILKKTGGLILFLLLFLSCSDKENYPEVIRTDVLYSLGANKYGVLGIGSYEDEFTPQYVSGIRDIVDISASSILTMVLTSNGKVFCWGSNIARQLCLPETIEYKNVPVLIQGLPFIIKIETRGTLCLALDENGLVWMWGTIYEEDPDINPPYFMSYVPLKIQGLTDVTDIKCGTYHCTALTMDGKVWTWGRQIVGVLGDGSQNDRMTPGQVPGLNGIKQIAVGAYFNLALKNNGQVYSWGYNLHGELGNGNTQTQQTPVEVGPMSNASYIVTGSSHSLCLDNNGTLWAWGENYFGELGINNNISQKNPVVCTYFGEISQLSAGGSCSIAVSSDGKFWSWGAYKFNSDQSGYSGYTKKIPTRIPCMDNAKLIATGGFHYIAVMQEPDMVFQESCFEGPDY